MDHDVFRYLTVFIVVSLLQMTSLRRNQPPMALPTTQGKNRFGCALDTVARTEAGNVVVAAMPLVEETGEYFACDRLRPLSRGGQREWTGLFSAARGTLMILRIGLLLAGCFLIGQAQMRSSSTITGSKADSPSPEERLRSFQKRFPPEVWSTSDQANFTRRSTSYCMSRSPETRSLVFRPCQPQNKFRLLPPIKVQPEKRVQ